MRSFNFPTTFLSQATLGVVALVLLNAVTAAARHSITAPESVRAGAQFDVTLSGPVGSGDFIAIVEKDHSMGNGGRNYSYFHKPPGAELRAPDEPGLEYDLRLHEGRPPYKLLARRPIVVEGASASLEAPAPVEVGARFQVKWSGPGGPGDTIVMAKIGIAPRQRVAYAYPARNPAALVAPDQAGEYELRYLTGQSFVILTRRPIRVGGTEASLDAPAEVQAGAALAVGWQGPNNPGDVINVIRAGSPRRVAWAYPETAILSG